MLGTPYVSLRSDGERSQASAGFALSEILSERVMVDLDRSSASVERLHAAHRDSVRLMQLLSTWPSESEAVAELHIVSHPSLDTSRASRVDISVQFRTFGGNKTAALEQCLYDSVNLRGLLEALWPSAQFEAISTAAEFQGRFQPFQPRSCVRIGRLVRELSLSRPFERRSRSVGFQEQDHPPVVEGQHVQHVFPWVPAIDDWAVLLRVLLGFPTPLWIVVRMANGTAATETMARLQAVISASEQFLSQAPADQTTLTQQAAALRTVSLGRLLQLSNGALRGRVLLMAPGRADEVVAGVLGQSLSGDTTRVRVDNLFEGGYQIEHAEQEAIESFDTEPWTPTEAACAFRLPLVFSDEALGLPVARHRTIPAPCLPPVTSGTPTRLGVNHHHGVDRPIEIDVQQRLRHVALFGMTGSGKSTMLETMFLQDLRAGHGCCFIDPHGDSANQILTRFPEERQEDLVVIDFEDRERPIPINLLAWKTTEERDLIIDEMLSTLLRIYRDPSMFGPIFEQNFRNVLKLLMGDRPNREFTATLLEFPKVYLSAAFRHYLADHIEDEQVKDFLAEAERISYGEAKLENLAPYITNKFGRFLQDTLLRRIIGHGDLALDFVEILDQGKVVILKLARGRFGSAVADLITSQIVRRFRWAAMSRSAERRPYFVYVDEFGSLAGDDTFAHMLSESRKYGLGLVLASQYTRQLQDADRAKSALSAVLGNVGTILCYRVGAEDAPLLAPIFGSSVSPQDLIECPNWQGYVRLHTNQFSTRPFSFHNQIDTSFPNSDRARRLAQLSRERWGVPAEECDEHAHRRNRWIRSLGV